MNHPVVVAHRGDPIHEVENTLPALLSAVAQGADLVETDVRLTVDGEVVLLHDATTERIWGDPRPAAAQTLAEITAHRPTVTPNPDGDADARVPSLADALLAIAPAALLIDRTTSRRHAPPGASSRRSCASRSRPMGSPPPYPRPAGAASLRAYGRCGPWTRARRSG
jgi:hypothetical protein